MGGGGQTTDQSPWSGQQPFLKFGYNQAQDQYDTPIMRYAGQRIGDLSAQTQEARQGGLDMIRGAGGGTGQSYIDQLLGGDFLDASSNPALRGMADQGAADITRQFRTAVAPGMSMAGFGRSGSGAESNMQQQAFRGLGDALAANYNNVYGQNYQRERGYQQQGIGMANSFDANTRQNLGFGAAMGQGADIRQQQFANEDISRFQFGQQEPGRRLDDFQRRIQGAGVIPGQSSMSAPGMTTGQGVGAGISALGMILPLLMGCSRSYKHEISPVDPEACFNVIKEMPIVVWRYTEEFLKKQDEAGAPLSPQPHMGPYAEDFKMLLGLGDGKTIWGPDMLGFALAAVKGACAHINELAEGLGNAMNRIDQLEKAMAKTDAPEKFFLEEVPA